MLNPVCFKQTLKEQHICLHEEERHARVTESPRVWENPRPSQFNTTAVAEEVLGYTSNTGRAGNPGTQRCVMKGLWKQELKGRSLSKIMALQSHVALWAFQKTFKHLISFGSQRIVGNSQASHYYSHFTDGET